MAVSSLFTLIDDIATVLDDVALLTKIAAKKTAGVLGDDLALNAEQVTGVQAERELPVVWAVAKGSLRNKAILVPAALAISALAHWAVTPLLMLGGLYLCFEGAEKIIHHLLHPRTPVDITDDQADAEMAMALFTKDLAAVEHAKIGGAIRTDFILSAEIITITLGTVADAAFGKQVAVLCGIAVLMTVGVYGLVAVIVKLDDVGLYLSLRKGATRTKRLLRLIGRTLVTAAPPLMKTLSVVGTAAMFLVGGGILLHGLPGAEAQVAQWVAPLGLWPGPLAWLATLVPTLLNGALGLLAGVLLVGVMAAVARLRGRRAHG